MKITQEVREFAAEQSQSAESFLAVAITPYEAEAGMG